MEKSILYCRLYSFDYLFYLNLFEAKESVESGQTHRSPSVPDGIGPRFLCARHFEN